MLVERRFKEVLLCQMYKTTLRNEVKYEAQPSTFFLFVLAIAGFGPVNSKAKGAIRHRGRWDYSRRLCRTRDARGITDISLDPGSREAILGVEDGISERGRLHSQPLPS
jgi:hypothetical protein